MSKIPSKFQCRVTAWVYQTAILFSGSAALIPLSGCQAPGEMTGPTEMMLTVIDYDRFVDNTLTLLREHDFPPKRVDRASGRIVAGPTTSGQWFEWWRADSQGPYQVLESSLHTIQREVTVNLQPVSGATQPAAGVSQPYRVAVQVEKMRYNAPERQVTTASGALQIYSERLPTTEGLKHSSTPGESWVPLGRDGLLESYLIQRIARLPTSGVEGAAEADDVSDVEPATSTD